jgi:hypothetical protein
MSADSSTTLPPSIRGVVTNAIALVVATFFGTLFAYFGWKSLGAGLALAFPTMMAGASVFAVGMAWAAVVKMRLLWEPSIPRAHEGILDVRFPRQLCRGLRSAGIGGALFTVGALMGVWAILIDEPVTWFRAGAALFMVLMLLVLALVFIGALLSDRVRFVADGWGLRWDGPLGLASIKVAWTEITRLSRREKGMLAPRLVATTQEGRTLGFPIPAMSLPVSREARAALLDEIESLRPVHEPDLE